MESTFYLDSGHSVYLQIICAWHLYTEISAVHIVSKEEIACLIWWSANFEQLHKIIELAVDVTTHCNIALHRTTFVTYLNEQQIIDRLREKCIANVPELVISN